MTWLDALHLLDSSFPTGAYAHSLGLESLAPSNLESALLQRTEESLARLELVFLLRAYCDDLCELDRRLHFSLLVREPRQASSVIGASLLRSVCDLLDDARLAEFLRTGEHHHQAVVFGAVAAAVDLPSDMAAEAYALNSLRAQVSAAQRLGWIGQREAQRVLHRLKPAVRAASTQAAGMRLDEAGAFTPLWDIAAMHHAHAPARMFAS